MDKLDALLGAVETQQTKIDSLIAMFEVLKKQWVSGTRKVFRELPPLAW